MRRNQALFLFPWTYCIVKLFYGNRNSSFTEKLQNQSYWQTWQTPFGWQGKQREAGPFGRSRKMRRHESQSGERARGRERERAREREAFTASVCACCGVSSLFPGDMDRLHARGCSLADKIQNYPINHALSPPITSSPLNIINSNGDTSSGRGRRRPCVCVCVCLGWEGGRWSNVFVWDPIKKRREREREQKGPKQNKKKKKQHSWWLLTLWP